MENKKQQLAIIKLGAKADLSLDDKSGSTGEFLSICKMLANSDDVQDLTVFTTENSHLVKFDVLPSNVYIDTDLKHINKFRFSRLLIVNGLLSLTDNHENNFYQTQQINLIEDSDIEKYYLLCDPLLIPKSPPEFRKITKKLDFICQPYDILSVAELLSKNDVKFNKISHFPFYKFPLFFDHIESEKTVDLIYGGNFRKGSRKEKIEEFYCNLPTNIKVEIFGRIKPEDINNTTGNVTFSESISHENFQEKISNSLATVSIGDEWYNGKNFNQRIFEAINADVISFIDIELDPERKIYGYSVLADFLYVKTKDDIKNKILYLEYIDNQIKHNKLCDEDSLQLSYDMRYPFTERLLDFQYEATYTNYKDYSNDLLKLIS